MLAEVDDEVVTEVQFSGDVGIRAWVSFAIRPPNSIISNQPSGLWLIRSLNTRLYECRANARYSELLRSTAVEYAPRENA